MFLCHDLLPFLLVESPHTIELGSSPLALLHAQFVVEPVSSLLLLYSWSVLCWAATQVLLVVACLELTWMLPGSLLRYHEKIKAACCLCCCSARLLSVGLGPVVTPGRLKTCCTRMSCWHDQMYSCITIVHARVCCT